MAVVLALMIAAQAGGRNALKAISPGNSKSNTGLIVEGALGFLAVYLGLGTWLWLRHKRPFWTLGFENIRLRRSVLVGALSAGLMIAAVAGLDIVGGASLSREKILTTGAALAIAFLSLLSHTLHASAEEALFRGWLLPVLGSRYGALRGVLVSAFLFSVAHATNVAGHSDVAFAALLNLLLFGIFAAVYALADGGLWGICAWHTFWNWAQSDLFGLPLDGGVHSGLLVSIHPNGPVILTGGTFGPEGGLAVTGVLVVGILCIFNMEERKQ